MPLLKNKKFNKFLSIWLLVLISMVIFIIFIGGLTRLTDSGLSITEWQVFSGILYPITDDQWNYYFQLYKEIPQYNLINNLMSINDFKFIFFWEYFHRMLGRLIGITFIIPFTYLIYVRALKIEYIIKFFVIFLLISFQGFIGWYMVQSGLVNNVSVSHYRLSIHLFFAFIILSTLLWYYLNLSTQINKSFFNSTNSFSSIKILIYLIFTQIIFGAFVSGLDAGKIYQTWPLMNNSYFPDDSYLINVLNFDNQSIVQFIHRNLAYVIFFISLFIGYQIIFKKIIKLIRSYYIFIFFIVLQIVLGIITLLSNVNIYIASMHQISSIFLVIFSLKLYHRSID